MTKDYTLDLASLFQAVGIKSNAKALITEHTHDFDPKFPKNHWLYAAFLGFQEYGKRHGKIGSFATIGTGPGIDAIGACEILKPRKIFLTDVHPNIPAIAKKNVLQNIDSSVEVKAYQGDLCQPLIQNNVRVDLVYANIPNIPSDQPRFDAKDSASFYTKRSVRVPDVFEKHLLSLQFLFLQEAKQILNAGGAVIDAIGGRVPYDILEKLFVSHGYVFEELVSVFKIQTEPEYVLKGYAEAEERYGVEFDFYSYGSANAHWLTLAQKQLPGPALKQELAKFRVNATSAYNDFTKSGNDFGHIVHLLCGRI
jgi:methylase of polypeptide subunit release factors